MKTGPVVHPFWPLFDLEVRTPRLTLRYPDDGRMAELAALARAGVHDPEEMPFSVPWTDARSPEREWNSYRYWWKSRAETSAEHWDIEFAVIVDGKVVGCPGLGRGSVPPTTSLHDRLVARPRVPGTRHRQGDAGRHPASRIRRLRRRGRHHGSLVRQRLAPSPSRATSATRSTASTGCSNARPQLTSCASA